MSVSKRSALGLVRTSVGEQTVWALVGEASLRHITAARITTLELEALPVDRAEASRHVAEVMSALEAYSSRRAETPGGASWLYVQHVPVRRLITQLVRKLLALSAWSEFAEAPGPVTLAPYEGLLGLRDSSSREYRAYTVTWSGVAYILGARAPHTTVNVQHGAWMPESVAWPALHSRHIVVMGDRDVAPARAWVRHPKAEIHVLGQPRFDALAGLGREAQRRYLQKLLGAGNERGPERIAVWACQPFGPDRLRAQADIILEGVWKTQSSWGLVVAPHPAQGNHAFDHLLRRDVRPLVAVADPRVGARGCLAGADAVVSVSSTCGIEAVLLDVPVVELDRPGDRTLGLAEHAIAHRCRTAADVTEALDLVSRGSARVPAEACDAVCRWRGHSAGDIAQLIIRQAEVGISHADPTDHDARGATFGLLRGEGATIR
ncbi:hypothetical protein [Streptomyces halobius]|uniref:CDP-glycerol:poly(Glycerophosphate) glycerophosphotransferase n=1 Tax=Streptomyces halobius TaxID=2879846 RepID=A0ABY4MFT8_9ACTN|nr:hypothetical protein [Streptomyces halobius]UQA96567.1 hypothetical protein K9S39_36005 [Streptomyces halobius]